MLLKLINKRKNTTFYTREFDLEDTYRFFMARYLRQADFDIKETADLLDEVSNLKIADALGSKENQIENQIVYLNRLLQRLRSIRSSILLASNEKIKFSKIRSPKFKELILPSNVQQLKGKTVNSIFQKWSKLLPVTTACLHYCFNSEKHDYFLPSFSDINLIATYSDFLKFKLPDDSTLVKTIPSYLCLHAIVSWQADENTLVHPSWLKQIHNYVAKHSLKISGNILDTVLFILSNKKCNQRWDELWIPIR